MNQPTKPIKLCELLDALETDLPEHIVRIDRQEAKVVIVDEYVMKAVQENDEEALDRLSDWQKPEIDIAKAMLEDPGARFIVPPDKFEFHEYRHMEGFISTIRSEQVADQLWRAIKGKGAFRHFKNTAARLGLLDSWYKYRLEAMKRFIVDWAEGHNVAFINNLKDRGA